MISQAQNNERLTTAITTLDYHTLWNSLHAAHSVGFKERGTNVIAADVICHGRGRASDKVPRTTFLRGKNAKREDIKKRIDRVR